MRILGVDPGSRICGYGVLDALGARSFRYIECGVLTANPRHPMEVRLGQIARYLTDVITELRPEAMAVEDVFTSVNHRSALALAQARGAVLAAAGMAGLPVHAYAPALVKKMVTGRGRAQKDQVARMVQTLAGLRRPPRADAADALAVAIVHAYRNDAIAALAKEAL
jgi:crossover junction endodeoxyribonuclease RuvC